MNLLLIQTMAGLTKHKTCSEKWGDTYQSAHVSVSCATCPSPSGVTPLNPSPSHRPHHAGCLQPLDCVGEKVKDYRNKKTVRTCSLFWVLLPTCYMIWSFVQHNNKKKTYWKDGGLESPMPWLLSWDGGRSDWLSATEHPSEWEPSEDTSY